MEIQLNPLLHSDPAPALPIMPQQIPHGIADTPSTLVLQASPLCCEWITRAIEWIKSIFRSPPTAIIPSHDQLIAKGNEFIDVQFRVPGLSYPLKSIVVIRYNDTILSTPFREISTSDFSTFKAEVKRVLEEKIRELPVDSSNTANLAVETRFFIRRGTGAPCYNIITNRNHLNLRNGAGGGGGGEASDLYGRTLIQYLRSIDPGNENRLIEFVRFLAS